MITVQHNGNLLFLKIFKKVIVNKYVALKEVEIDNGVTFRLTSTTFFLSINGRSRFFSLGDLFLGRTRVRYTAVGGVDFVKDDSGRFVLFQCEKVTTHRFSKVVEGGYYSFVTTPSGDIDKTCESPKIKASTPEEAVRIFKDTFVTKDA